MSNHLPEISKFIWDQKYRLKTFDGTPIDETIHDTWSRVAKALSACEKPEHREGWEQEFTEIMADGFFSPAGRIISGAGTGRNVTLSNCLSGETLILTAEYGLVPIGEIAGEVVNVLDGNGNWVEAPINTFGFQKTAPVTLKGGYNGRERKTIHATAEHRWILEDGDESTTEHLDAGNVLKFVRREDVDHNQAYLAGVRHGVVYGDGSQRPEGEVKLRLCGQKKELVGFFENWTITSPESSDGDLNIYCGREQGRQTDLKNLPRVGTCVEYLTGFLRGWMATDGCVTRGKALISGGAHEADWLRKFGPIAGMEVSCVTKLGDETNYGQRNKTLFNVHFHRWTMIEEDFILESHRSKFEATEYPWIVESVGVMGEPEPVYCPRVTTTDSVQLDLGIHTGQCFTMGTIPDSMDGIFSNLKEAALTMQQGGGIGYDFSTIRPKGAEVKGVAADASGPLSFMDVWDAMCRTVMSAGSRRGAMMATMRCDHPDIEQFIEAKRDPLKLRMFNLSVLVTDDFMAAVKAGAPWRLHFEDRHGVTLVEKEIDARGLWEKIMRNTYDFAEPGVIFIDRVNADHNLGYLETIATTNPCGEKPMGPYASCLLGSINLAKLVRKPFEPGAHLWKSRLREVVTSAIRFMDNVIEVGNFPLEKQREKAKADRQLGLGVTGLADALIMCGITYGSDEAVRWTDDIMREVTLAAYQASINLARERGAFPTFDSAAFLEKGRFAGRMLPEEMKRDIRTFGIRNGLLVSIAPTGTISMFAGNVSSGVEPVFAYEYERKVLQPDGSKITQTVEDYAVAEYRRFLGDSGLDNEKLPEEFVSAQTLSPEAHVRMQAAAQKWVDSSISKTVNCPEDISFTEFQAVYFQAYESGCKGCTTYRPNAITGSILSVKEAPKPEPQVAKISEQERDDLVASARDFLSVGDKDQRATALKTLLSALGLTRVSDVKTLSEYGAVAQLFAPTEGNESVQVDSPIMARVISPGGAVLFDGQALEAGMEDWPEGDGMTLTLVVPDAPEEGPQARPEMLPGAVYKVKWPNSEHAIYVAVTDIQDATTGQRRPFEVFINSKNMEHFAWTVALTRMISAIFRRPHDSRFVVAELKAVFDPQGGAWMGGKFVPSVLAAIGNVIETHMIAIGYMDAPERAVSVPEAMAAPYGSDQVEPVAFKPSGPSTEAFKAGFNTPFCQKCFGTNLKNEAGCFQCLDCGHSKCG